MIDSGSFLLEFEYAVKINNGDESEFGVPNDEGDFSSLLCPQIL